MASILANGTTMVTESTKVASGHSPWSQNSITPVIRVLVCTRPSSLKVMKGNRQAMENSTRPARLRAIT